MNLNACAEKAQLSEAFQKKYLISSQGKCLYMGNITKIGSPPLILLIPLMLNKAQSLHLAIILLVVQTHRYTLNLKLGLSKI